MADDELIFDPDKCDVDRVTRIPTGGLLTDPTVPAPPDPITECQLVPIVELPQEFPCPDVTVTESSVFLGYRADESKITEPALLFTVTKGTCCEFDFQIVLEIPDIVCPEITSLATDGHAITLTSGTEGALPDGKIYLTVVKDLDTCAFEFDVDFDFTFSCPALTSNAELGKDISVSQGLDGALPEGKISLTVSNTVDCSFEFDVDFDFTFSCPALTSNSADGTAAVVTQGTAGDLPEATISLTINNTEDCAFEFDVNFDLTFSCPSLTSLTESGTAVTVTQGIPGALPEATLYLTVTNTENCSFEFAIEGELTFSCPAITSAAKDGIPVVISRTGTEPSGTITLTVTTAEDCSFDFNVNLDLALPCPIMTALTTDGAPVTVSTGIAGKLPTGTIYLTAEPADNCSYDFDVSLDLTFSCPALTSISDAGTSVTFTREGTPVAGDTPPTGSIFLGIANTEDCAFEFSADLELDLPCAKMTSLTDTGTDVYVERGVDGDLPTGTIYLTVENTEDCSYEFTADLDIVASCPSLTSLSEDGTDVEVTMVDPETLPTGKIYLSVNNTENCIFEFQVGLELSLPDRSVVYMIRVSSTTLTVNGNYPGFIVAYDPVSNTYVDLTYIEIQPIGGGSLLVQPYVGVLIGSIGGSPLYGATGGGGGSGGTGGILIKVISTTPDVYGHYLGYLLSFNPATNAFSLVLDGIAPVIVRVHDVDHAPLLTQVYISSLGGVDPNGRLLYLVRTCADDVHIRVTNNVKDANGNYDGKLLGYNDLTDRFEEQYDIKVREVNDYQLKEQDYLGRFRGIIGTGSLSLSYSGPDTYDYLYSVQIVSSCVTSVQCVGGVLVVTYG
jgi:hypothetical protein